MQNLRSLILLSFIFMSMTAFGQCPSTIASLGVGNGMQICWQDGTAPSSLDSITYDGITYAGEFVNAGQGDCWRTTDPATLGTNGNHTLEFVIDGAIFSSCMVEDGNVSSDLLPIEIAYFGAAVQENSILVEWQTLEEENNDYFEVQRSVDGVEFETIAEVYGAGTTSEMQFYEFEDEQAIYQNGNYYYRLKQVDFDGNSSYSDVVAVTVQNQTEFTVNQVYPNPAQAQVNLILDIDHHHPTHIYVVDATGRVVKTSAIEAGQTGVQQVQVQVAELQAGFYFLRIEAGTYAHTEKFIKA